MTSLTPQELQVWLEWAGARLIAMPGARPGPNGTKVIWPEYAQELFQVIEFRPGMRIRAPIPSAEDITLTEEILVLPAFCEYAKARRTIRLRTLMHPVHERHIYSWADIAKKLEIDRKTAASLYSRGLREIARKVPCQQARRIARRFDEIADV